MTCPLCGETVTDHDAYVAHLADAHGLVDDPGTKSEPVVVERDAPVAAMPPPPPPPPGTSSVPPLPPGGQPPDAARDKRMIIIALGVAAIVVLVAGALLLRKPDSSTDEAATGSTIPTTTRAPDAAPPVDAARVAGVNVQPSDLPADWATSPQLGTSQADEAAVDALMTCLGIERPELDHDVRSFHFKSPDGTMAVQSDVMYGAASGLEQYEAALAGPSGSDCVKGLVEGQTLRPDLPSGISVAGVEVSDPRPVGGGDQGSAFTVTVTYDAAGRKVPVSTDFVSVRVGPLVAETYLARSAAARSAGIADGLVAAELDRARALVG